MMSADHALFDCVACGVDGTDESRAAVAQVGRLLDGLETRSRVVLVSVWNTGASVAVVWSPPVARTKRRHASSFGRIDPAASSGSSSSASAGVSERTSSSADVP